MDLAAELDLWPHELLLELLSHIPGPALSIFSEHSARIKALISTVSFRDRWLRTMGIDFGKVMTESLELARYFQLAHSLDPRWAKSMYHGTTLHIRIQVIEGLLGCKETWPAAIDLANIDKEADLQMEDHTYGIFNRHLLWRFQWHQCPI